MKWNTDIEKVEILLKYFKEIRIEKDPYYKYHRYVIFVTNNDKTIKVSAHTFEDLRTEKGKALIKRIAFCDAGKEPKNVFIETLGKKKAYEILYAMRSDDEHKYYHFKKCIEDQSHEIYEGEANLKEFEKEYIKIYKKEELEKALNICKDIQGYLKKINKSCFRSIADIHNCRNISHDAGNVDNKIDGLLYVLHHFIQDWK